MPPVALIASALPSLFQAGVGISQMMKGKKSLAGLQRPEYVTPDETKQNLALARSQYADPSFPGQNLAIDTNNLSAVNAAKAAIEGGGGIASLAAIASAQAKGGQQISAMANDYQRKDMQTYMEQQKIMSEQKDLEWQMNKFAPYMQKYNEGREQIGAGQQNTMSALSSLGSLGVNAFMNTDMFGSNKIDASSIGTAANADASSASTANIFAKAAIGMMQQSMATPAAKNLMNTPFPILNKVTPW